MLELSPRQRTELRERCEQAHPSEACGLLQGLRCDTSWKVSRIVPTRNVATKSSHERFEIDPDEFLRAALAARAQGEEIIGVHHSHPDRPAAPSVADFQEAQPGWVYLIVSVDDGRSADERAWTLAEGSPEGFVEIPVVVKTGAADATRPADITRAADATTRV